MTELTLHTSSGYEAVIPQEAIDGLADGLRGELLTPNSAGYDEARTIWNAMIDRRPGLIARCAGTSDVMQAVNFVRNHELLVSIKGGGHNIAGNAVCDGGLMIDLSPMKSVQVDPGSRTARVEPGVTLGEFDKEAQVFGLATPLGINSTTGVAGLTLGGGFGWLSRKYGLSVDNLISADVVTRNGELKKASKNENTDLFWGIRGGGGNFGIVTSFEFQLHQVGPQILSGLIVHPFKDAKAVLLRWREFVASMPDELACWVVLRKAPPLPALPEEVHGTEVVLLVVCYAGDMDKGREVLKPLREFGNPIADLIVPHQYTAFQSAFDPLLTPGMRNYWKSHNFSMISDEAIDIIIQYAGELPTPQCELFVAHLGGAVARIAKDATAYANRDAEFILNVHTRWDDRAKDDEYIGWARKFFQTIAPHSTGGVYVNFLTQDEKERVNMAYGSNYDRLIKLKNKYDPTNLFHLNQNIPPIPYVPNRKGVIKRPVQKDYRL